MSIPIGIDLGTTNTVVAAVIDGRAVTLEDTDKTRLIPSIVSFHPSGSVLVGNSARDRRLIDSANTIFSIKRLIGRPWKSPEVQQALSRFPFDLREGPKETTMVVARGEQYALPEISAFVLRRAKQIAEAQLGTTVDRAVITVPANFNDLQRAATKVAGKLAGLDVLRILNEPTAAALAYGQSIAQSERIAIFDLGGGTFDITLLDLSGSVFEVLATAGDTALGGDDIDILIADRMADQFVQIHRYDPRTSPDAFSKLRIMAETMKIQLSTQPEASVELKEVGYGEGGKELSLRFRMTRAELEHLARDLIDRTTEVTRFAIETIGQRKEAFDRVILVGGATRMPLVAKKVEAYFGKPPYLKVNPDEVVALGAAIQAYSLDRSAKKKPSMAPPSRTMSVAEATQTANAASQRSEVSRPSDDSPQAMSSLDHAVVGAGPQTRIKTSPGFRQVTAAQAAPPPPPIQARTKGAETTGVTHPGHAPPLKVEIDDEGSIDTFVNLPRGATPEPPLMRTQSLGGASPPVAPAAKPPPVPSGAVTLKGAGHPPVPSMSFDMPDLPAPPPAMEFLPQTGRSISFADAETPEAPKDWGIALAAPMGEATSAINLAGIENRHAPLLIDVTPLSLSVETVAGWCDMLIGANSPVPCDRTRVFMTAADGQTVVNVRVAQGESRRFAENTYLGEVELSGLTPAPRGEVRVAVTFEIDADGILNVRAKDEETGNETGAKMKLLGAQTDATDVQAMLARQARHTVS